MKKISDKRYIFLLTAMCVAAYLVSYITRKNFAAIQAEFIVAEGLSKPAVSAIPVTMFICYGLGQLLSGWLGDKFSPGKIITVGFVMTAVINFIMPVLNANITAMTVFWGLNGLAQAFMWPPMVKIMTAKLTADVYKKAVLNVSIGGTVGTVLIYAISALFIKLSMGWRSVFVFSAICGTAMAIVWTVGMHAVEKHTKKHGTDYCLEPSDKEKSTKKKSGKFNPFTMSPIIVIMVAIVFQGMLRDGIESWMPTYLSETYSIETSGAILSSILLPLLTIVCIKFTSFIYNRFFKNELVCSAVIFGAGAVSALLLLAIHGRFAPLAVVFVATLSSAMHGVNLILICMIPPYYEKHGNVSFISGMINFCTYIGSAIFTYGIAEIAENASWRTTIFSWVIVAVIGTLLCVFTIRPWKKFKKSDL